MTAFCGHANTSLVTDRRRCLPDRPEPGRDVLSHRSCARPPVFRRPRALFGGRWPDGKVLSDEWVRGSCVLEPDGGRNDCDEAVGTDPSVRLGRESRRLESLSGGRPVADQTIPGPAADAHDDRTGKNVEYHCVAPVGFGRRWSTPLSLIMCQFRAEKRCLPMSWSGARILRKASLRRAPWMVNSP